MCSKDQWMRETGTGHTETETATSLKKSRFRFSESERLKCLKELFNTLCEVEVETEEELWQNLHSIMCHDNPRFKNCSLRLLRDHMLEQVARFKKYDLEEATESGKERLQSEWGDALRLLLTVWCNYEQLVNTDAQRKKNKPGRPRKENTIQKKTDAELAKVIREAALQTIEEFPEFNEIDDVNYEDTASTINSNIYPDSNDVPDENEQNVQNRLQEVRGLESSNERDVNVVTVNRKHTSQAKKSRNNSKGNGVFLYLSEKTKYEHEYKEKELKFKERQHSDNIKLQQEEIAYKRARLEFEERKWKEQAEERNQERQRNDKVINLLENVLMSSHFNK